MSMCPSCAGLTPRWSSAPAAQSVRSSRVSSERRLQISVFIQLIRLRCSYKNISLSSLSSTIRWCVWVLLKKTCSLFYFDDNFELELCFSCRNPDKVLGVPQLCSRFWKEVRLTNAWMSSNIKLFSLRQACTQSGCTDYALSHGSSAPARLQSHNVDNNSRVNIQLCRHSPSFILFHLNAEGVEYFFLADAAYVQSAIISIVSRWCSAFPRRPPHQVKLRSKQKGGDARARVGTLCRASGSEIGYGQKRSKGSDLQGSQPC